MTAWEAHPLCGPPPLPARFWGPELLFPDAWRAFAAMLEPDAEIACILAALAGATDVIDVGGGTGTLTRAIARTRPVTIVEPSAEQRAHRPAGLAAIAGRAEAVPAGDGAFDAAIATWVLHYCDDPDRAVGELARIARRRVVVVQAAPGNALVDIYNAGAAAIGLPPAHHGYLLARAAAILERAGFAVALERVAIPLRAPTADVLARMHFTGHPRLAAITAATEAALAGRTVLPDDGVVLSAQR